MTDTKLIEELEGYGSHCMNTGQGQVADLVDRAIAALTAPSMSHEDWLDSKSTLKTRVVAGEEVYEHFIATEDVRIYLNTLPAYNAETQGYWWCHECKREIDAKEVTFSEHHETCGMPAAWMQPTIQAQKTADKEEQ